MKYIIQSNKLQDGKWQPAYYPPPNISGGRATFSDKTEFREERFNTKEESDSFAFQYLIKRGISKNKIETK